jgi:subtilisin family serine protease
LRVLADPKVTDPNVVKVAKAPNNIQVVNLSVWTTQSFWPTETNLINALKTKVIVVASSGNATVAPGNLSQVRHPAALPYAISVGAFCKDGTRWTGTNTAKPDTGRTPEVDIDAPGERILSALPLNMNAKGAKFGGFLTGTSMATPYVTAYVAKLRSDGMSARDVIAGRLKQNSQKKSDGSGKSWYPMKW